MSHTPSLTSHVADPDSAHRLLPGVTPFRSRLIRGVKRTETVTTPNSQARLIIAAAIPEAPTAPRVRRFRRD